MVDYDGHLPTKHKAYSFNRKPQKLWKWQNLILDYETENDLIVFRETFEFNCTDNE